MAVFGAIGFCVELQFVCEAGYYLELQFEDKPGYFGSPLATSGSGPAAGFGDSDRLRRQRS